MDTAPGAAAPGGRRRIGIGAPRRRRFLYPPLWLLPGGAVLAGLLALAIGIAPLSRVARFVLGAAAKPAMLGPVGTNSTIGSSTPSPMPWPRTRPTVFALCGVATGAVTAAVCTVAKFGEVEPFAVAGYCLGVEVSGAGLFEGGACTGVNGWNRCQNLSFRESKCILPDLPWGRQSRTKARAAAGDLVSRLTPTGTNTPRRTQRGDFPT
jgi:hypothetical protein